MRKLNYLIWGDGKVGKTTLACSGGGVLVDLDGGYLFPFPRIEPRSWPALLQQVKAEHATGARRFIFDTCEDLRALIQDHVARLAGLESFEQFEWGNGWVQLKAEVTKLFLLLRDCELVFIAHKQDEIFLRKVDQVINLKRVNSNHVALVTGRVPFSRAVTIPYIDGWNSVSADDILLAIKDLDLRRHGDFARFAQATKSKEEILDALSRTGQEKEKDEQKT